MAERTASLSLIRKFLRRVEQLRRKHGLTDCWPWSQTAVRTNKYGRVWIGSRPAGNLEWFDAHRLSYEMFVAAIPDGRNVLHSCDAPPCINPAHLHIGDQLANVGEMWNRGRANPRGARGSTNAASRLTEARVLAIRERFAVGDVSYKELATEHGVTPECIGQIVRRQSWTHI